MNGIVSKIVLIFITVGLFFALTFYTFFAGEKKEIKAPVFNIEKNGETKSGSLIINKVDLFTTVYSYKNDYKVLKNNIIFGTGVYLIDSRHSFQKYVLDLGNNKIILDGGGMVYIDNNPKYKKFISFNNKVKIEFLKEVNDIKTNKKRKEKIVEMYLYPHMYFMFSPRRFKHVKKQIDSLRISQLGILKYFNSNFNDIINDKSDLKIITQLDKKNLLINSILDIINKQKIYSEELNNKRNIKISNISGISYIEKYFIIFYNERKKSIYYKNKILRDLIGLLNDSDKKTKLTYSIMLNLNSLKEVDLYEYNEMKLIIEKMYFLVLLDLGEKSSIVEYNFDKIITRIFSYNDNRGIKLLKGVDKYNFLGNIDYYFRLLDLKILGKNVNDLSIEYYILFKQNMLISNLKNEKLNQNLYDILLKGFVSYSRNVKNYFIKDDKNKTIQNILYNKDLLDIIYKSFGLRYFKKERDEQGLLILKNVKINNIEEVNNAVNFLFKKYKKSIGFLEDKRTKYNALMKKYDELELVLKEYLSALSNYSLYEENYSKVNRALIDVETYSEKEEKLSLKSFQDYIKQFSGINISSIDLEVVDNNYYKVKNIYINNYDFSFDFYPYQGNVVKNIIIKNRKFNDSTREFIFYNNLESTSFSLDEEEEKYKLWFDKAKDEEKENYDFRNFFISKFFPKEEKNDNKYEEYDDKFESTNNDDDVIQVFKRGKLIGKKGEFGKILNYLKINYNVLDVKRVSGNKYSIKIVNSIFKMRFGEKTYFADFNSNYRLSGGQHYFYKIILKFFLNDSSGEKRLIFPQNVNFKISGKIDLVDFEKYFKIILEELPRIQQEYRKQENKDKISEIIYSPKFKKVSFK